MSDQSKDNPKVNAFSLPESNDSVIYVPLAGAAEFHKKLASLNRRAQKIGVAPIEIAQTQEVYFAQTYHTEHASSGDLVTAILTRIDSPRALPPEASLVKALRMQISYPDIRINGWRTIARIEPLGKDANLIFCISDNEEDRAQAASMRQCKIGCEHCKTERYRTASFLLKNEETGQYMEVGKSCLKDFLGHDPAAILFLLQMRNTVRINEDCDEGSERAWRPNAMPLRNYLADVAYSVEFCGGFVSRQKARDTGDMSTADHARTLPEQIRSSHDEAFRQKWHGSRERLLEKADKIIEWARNQEVADEFMLNLKTLFALDDISFDHRHLGLAAAAVPSYHRAMEAARERSVEAAQSSHQGDPGQKMEAVLHVVKSIEVLAYRGGTDVLAIMKDDEGNVYKWRSTACPPFVADRDLHGQRFKASFTVKQHEDYKGVAQTTVTRVKLIDWANTPSQPDADANSPEDAQPQRKKSPDMSM